MTADGKSQYTFMQVSWPDARVRGFFHYLKSQGYEPFLVEEGEEEAVAFEYRGRTYCLALEADDPYLFQLFPVDTWEIAKEADPSKLEQVAAMVMSTHKGVKVGIEDSEVILILYTFAASDAVFQQVFHRWMEELHSALRSFEEASPKGLKSSEA
jgi:hypothetical protein